MDINLSESISVKVQHELPATKTKAVGFSINTEKGTLNVQYRLGAIIDGIEVYEDKVREINMAGVAFQQFMSEAGNSILFESVRLAIYDMLAKMLAPVEQV